MNIPIPAQLQALARRFADAGATLYGVGGMVRSPLLGKPVSDYDTCSALLPERVQELCRAWDIRCVDTGARFGTMTLLLSGGFKTEHTTFRSDVYATGGAHQPQEVRFSGSLITDARRRDFTVNAMYVDLLTGGILDPTGGLADLAARRIRATTADPGLILRDDGLRILRMVRFAALLDFSVDPATQAAAAEYAAGLRDISAERVRDELYRLMAAEPGPLVRALELLDEIGAWDYVIPELTRGRGVEQDPVYHAYPVLEHAFHTCAAMAGPDPVLKLAALLHDVGKPYALEANQGREGSPMQGHDKIGAEISREILTRLKCTNTDRERVAALVAHHMYDLNGAAREDTLRTRFAGWGVALTRDLIALRRADVHGSGRTMGPVPTADRWERVLNDMLREGAPFSEEELKCTGEDIMAWLDLPPGPQVGRIKRQLLLHCARKPAQNNPAALRRAARGMAGQAAQDNPR